MLQLKALLINIFLLAIIAMDNWELVLQKIKIRHRKSQMTKKLYNSFAQHIAHLLLNNLVKFMYGAIMAMEI